MSINSILCTVNMFGYIRGRGVHENVIKCHIGVGGLANVSLEIFLRFFRRFRNILKTIFHYYDKYMFITLYPRTIFIKSIRKLSKWFY